MKDWVLFRGLPEAAVHRKTTSAIQTEGNVRPGRVAAQVITFVTPGISPIP